MATATKTRPQRRVIPKPPAALTPSNSAIITAYAIVKAPIGGNLWQLVTYKIQDDIIIDTHKSVENLREILITQVPDMMGGLQ